MVAICFFLTICFLCVASVPMCISGFTPIVWSHRRRHHSPASTPPRPVFQLDGQAQSTDLSTLYQESQATHDALRRPEGIGACLVEISRIVQEAPGVISLSMTACDGNRRLPRFLPGQHIVVHRPATGSQPAAKRCYSLSGAPEETWRITVKDASSNKNESSVSGWIHRTIREGDRLLVSGPKGKFTLELASDTKPVVFIAAGVGITPMAAMIHHELQFTRSRKKWLFYQVTDIDHAPLLGELCKTIERASKHQSTSIAGVVACSRDSLLPETFTFDDNKPMRLIQGKLSAKKIVEALQTSEVSVFLCGPEAWMESLRQGFQDEGVASSSIYYESFGEAAPRSGVNTQHELSEREPSRRELSRHSEINEDKLSSTAVGFKVQFTDSGKESTFDGSQADLLSQAKATGVSISSGCRMGNCGSCTVKLLKGRVRYLSPPESPIASDEILPCICVPDSDLVIQA